MIDQAVISGISFLTAVLVGRVGGKTELGIYTLGMSVVLLAISIQQSLVSAPHTIFVIRFHGPERLKYNGSLLSQAIILNLLLLAMIVLAGLVFVTGLGPDEGAWIMAVLLITCPAVLLREFGRRFMFAHMNMSGALFLDVGIAFIQLAALGLLYATGCLTGISGLIAVGLACAISGATWMWTCREKFELDREWLVPEARRSWDFGRWVFGGQVSVALVAVVMNWLLAGIHGEDATGVYGACMMLILLANPFILGIQNLLSPNMAQAMHQQGSQRVRYLVGRSTLALAGMMGAFALVIGIWGDPLVQLIYTEDYGGNQWAIGLLACGAFALSVGVSSNHGLRAIERPEVNFYAAVCGLLAGCLVAAVWIPGHGVLGAAAGYFAACLVTATYRVLGFLYVSRNSTGVTEA